MLLAVSTTDIRNSIGREDVQIDDAFNAISVQSSEQSSLKKSLSVLYLFSLQNSHHSKNLFQFYICSVFRTVITQKISFSSISVQSSEQSSLKKSLSVLYLFSLQNCHHSKILFQFYICSVFRTVITQKFSFSSISVQFSEQSSLKKSLSVLNLFSLQNSHHSKNLFQFYICSVFRTVITQKISFSSKSVQSSEQSSLEKSLSVLNLFSLQNSHHSKNLFQFYICSVFRTVITQKIIPALPKFRKINKMH